MAAGPKTSKPIVMETRKHIAAERLNCGTHNCAQAVISTYADLIGIDEETARNLGNAFGAGMGTMEGTCGVLVGAGVVLGLATKDRTAARKVIEALPEQAAGNSFALVLGRNGKVVDFESPAIME